MAEKSATKIVRAYLETLNSKPRGRRTAEWMTERRDKVAQAIVETTDPIERVKLVQERIELERDLAGVVTEDERVHRAQEAVQVLKEYSEKHGITRAAWREVGVPAAFLDEAGVT